MAISHGKVGAFYLDDSGATLRDLSANLTSVDFSREVDTPESTVFGLDDRTYIAGLHGATISISGFWDDTANTGSNTVLEPLINLSTGVTQSFQYGPEGQVTGDVRYTGECICTAYNITGSVDGIVEFTADFQITGAVTADVSAFG